MRNYADVGRFALTVVVCPAADGPLGDGAARDDGGGGIGVLGGLDAAAAVARIVVAVVVHGVLGRHGLHVGAVAPPLALRARVGARLEEARGGHGRGAGVGGGAERRCGGRGVGGRRADDGRGGLLWRLRGAVVITCKERKKELLKA